MEGDGGNGSQEGVFFIWVFFFKKNTQKNTQDRKKHPKKTPKQKTPIFEIRHKKHPKKTPKKTPKKICLITAFFDWQETLNYSFHEFFDKIWVFFYPKKTPKRKNTHFQKSLKNAQKNTQKNTQKKHLPDYHCPMGKINKPR